MVYPFIDSGQTLADFAETIYVRCPVCQMCAHIRRIPNDEQEIFADISRRSAFLHHRGNIKAMLLMRRSFSPRKVSCLYCGHTRTWKGPACGNSGPQDLYFGLPLWLQVPCCGEILWAFNEEHLNFLESYVTATQRRKFHVEGKRRSRTMIRRLPLWIKSAKNRGEVLKGIKRLKGILEKL